MVEIKQEKNIARFYKNGEYVGCVDINTGKRYGKSGREVRKLAISQNETLSMQTEKEIPKFCYYLLHFATAAKSWSADGVELSIIESVTKVLCNSSLTVSADNLYNMLVEDREENWTALPKYFKEFENNQRELNRTNFYWSNFVCWRWSYEFENWIKQKNVRLENLTENEREAFRNFYTEIINTNALNLTQVEIDRIIGYITNQRIFSSIGIFALSKFCRYCKALNIEIPKTQCFTRTCAEIEQSYEAWKLSAQNERIQKNLAIHNDWWNFEYNGFTIVAPQSAQDLVKEGIQMHHCVGSYVDRVADGDTLIVFVRRTDDITTPYITCQVSNNGEIIQYYLAYDRCISSEIDRDFRRAFQNHIRECIMRGE